jgi:hypothetical protein
MLGSGLSRDSLDGAARSSSTSPWRATAAARGARAELSRTPCRRCTAGATLYSCGLDGEWRMGRKGEQTRDVFLPALPWLEVGRLRCAVGSGAGGWRLGLLVALDATWKAPIWACGAHHLLLSVEHACAASAGGGGAGAGASGPWLRSQCLGGPWTLPAPRKHVAASVLPVAAASAAATRRPCRQALPRAAAAATCR